MSFVCLILKILVAIPLYSSHAIAQGSGRWYIETWLFVRLLSTAYLVAIFQLL